MSDGKLIKSVNIPIELYQSQQGNYFVGYIDLVKFGQGKGAWGRLYNPYDSGKILHVNVWTITEFSDTPYEATFWFNATPPGTPVDSNLYTPSNTAIHPLPMPKVKIQSASEVYGEPVGGAKAFVRTGQPEMTLVDTENGKYIFPPGGSFLIFLSKPEAPDELAAGRLAFGWWEERIPIC